MKDIYELLNDIEMETDLENVAPVSEMEKKKVLKKLNQHMVKEKKQSKWKKALSAAIITFGIIASAIVGLSFTAYADDIPFLGNIFSFFSNDGSYVGYDENADEINLSQESNGIKITINDTVFDGETLFITYMIETNRDLGDSPWLNGMPVYGEHGLGSTERTSKIEEGKYISVMEVNHYSERELDEIDVTWKIDSISTEPNNEGTTFEGNWEFQFSVAAVESQSIAVNETIEEGDFTFTLEKIVITPMSFLLSYEHVVTNNVLDNWDTHSARVKVKDNLGNDYSFLSLGGTSSVDYSLNWTATYSQLNPDATELILTPIIELSDNETLGYDKNGNPIKADYRLIDSDADYEEIQLEAITVEIK